jgi:hypothetical protein
MSSVLKVIKSVALTEAMLIATDVPEDSSPEWSGAGVYAAGARVKVTSSHKVYQSLQADNTGKVPADEPLWWTEVGPTNRWKAFDLSSTTQTEIASAGYYEIKPGRAVNAVGLVNLAGVTSVRIRLTDPDFGVVYDRTIDMTYVPREATWWAWFFSPREEQRQLIVSDLPSYPNATLRVDTSSPGTAKVGGFIFGTQRSIGRGVRQGVRLGIQDFSRKERNEWGDTVLVQRAFAKRASFNLILDNIDLDNTFTLLSDMRSTPCLWIGSDRYNSTTVFGFFNNFEITIAYAMHSEVSIDIEGLT